MIRQGSRNILPGETLPDVEVVELKLSGRKQIRWGFKIVKNEWGKSLEYNYINTDEAHPKELPGEVVSVLMEITRGDKRYKAIEPGYERSLYVR